jgi:hypothetical protein
MRSVLHPLLVASAFALLASGAQGQSRSTAPSASPPPAGQPVPPGQPGAPGTGTTTVNPVTVEPQTTPQGKVVSSTDATSLQSPDYSDKDAQPPPRAVSLGHNAAAGVQTVTPTAPAGLPASLDPGPQRSEIGVTAAF